MAMLDMVMEMQRQGLSDSDISSRLMAQGVSPKEINDALNQARIKSAVSFQEDPSENQDYTQGMQPSIMQQNVQGQSNAQQAPQMYPPSQDYEPPAMQEYYPQAPQAYDANYDASYYGGQSPVDTEAVTEVAEQVASEKISEFKQSLGDINLFKTLVQEKLADMSERLKRIENTIDKINHSVLGKIGEFSDTNAMVHKDLENLHNTVSKLMNPLADNLHELKKRKNQFE